MAPHSSILVWEIPRTEETSGYSLQGCKELYMTVNYVHTTHTHTHTHTHTEESYPSCDDSKHNSSAAVPDSLASPTHHKEPKLRGFPKLKALMKHLPMPLLRRMDIIKMNFLASFISLFFLTNEASLNKHSYTNLSELLRCVNIISLIYIFLLRVIMYCILERKYLQRKSDLIKN